MIETQNKTLTYLYIYFLDFGNERSVISYQNVYQDVKMLYASLTTYMKANITFDVIFDTESYQKDRFNKIYVYFVKLVGQMEEKIISYTRV